MSQIKQEESPAQSAVLPRTSDIKSEPSDDFDLSTLRIQFEKKTTELELLRRRLQLEEEEKELERSRDNHEEIRRQYLNAAEESEELRDRLSRKLDTYHEMVAEVAERCYKMKAIAKKARSDGRLDIKQSIGLTAKTITFNNENNRDLEEHLGILQECLKLETELDGKLASLAELDDGERQAYTLLQCLKAGVRQSQEAIEQSEMEWCSMWGETSDSLYSTVEDSSSTGRMKRKLEHGSDSGYTTDPSKMDGIKIETEEVLLSELPPPRKRTKSCESGVSYR